MPVLKRLRAGYRLTDPSLHNLAYYDGEIEHDLLDPFAVSQIPEQT